ncbi:phage tail assembly chaperone [Pseudomonas sp. GM17]|uniref:phage tail assembly chaperone n=1 Tax=Pseudomonas sp. GM17 TaxID=1144323 RepID=UPI00027255EF|nr:phage tail assembly chaperone [Pseudomonas sp. GM17]WIE51811.1 phage tail assembly chaperone [Pseudomonas sp. GM17]
MALYARVEDDVVVELIETGGFMISQLFAADFLSSMVAVPEGVEVELGKPIHLPEQVAPLSPVVAAVAFASEVRGKATDEDAPDQARKWRQSVLTDSQWLVTRHRDEQELGRGTTLTANQYLELLEYRQALRDWPASDSFPEMTARPPIPEWSVSFFQIAD